MFDGADGGQVAFWTAKADRTSTKHAHDFDEYVLVVEGRATVIIGDEQTVLTAGMEMVIENLQLAYFVAAFVVWSVLLVISVGVLRLVGR